MSPIMRQTGLAILLLSGIGCGSTLVPVVGRVTFDGQPLEGATVTLIPEDSAGTPAFGFTDAAGRFQAHTNNDTGMRPGKYFVVVTKDEPAGPSAGPAPAGGNKRIDELTPEELAEGMRYNSQTPRRSVLPTRYADHATSELRVDIAPRQPELEISLKK